VTKERPRCRQVIKEQGLRPAFAFDTAAGLRVRPLKPGERWRSYFACAPGDDRPIWLTDGMRKQMKTMLAEGCFTEEEVA
jgi:hypothetical protein